VLISTHILPEVEMMCSRVVVIHRGSIRAMDTAENLIKNHRSVGELRLETRAGADAAGALQKIVGVKDVTETRDGDWNVFKLRLDANAKPGEEIMKLARERNWPVREMHQKSATLEDVFADLTTSDK
jgi:ABC-2 type transport system ATP-binding protein